MSIGPYPTIRGLLFDKDGTLIDFEASWRALFERFALETADGDADRAAALLREAGFDEDRGRFRAGSVIAAGTSGELVDLWRPGLDAEARAGAIGALEVEIARVAAADAVAACDLSVLGALAATGRYCLGLATNDTALSAEHCLTRLGVRDLFEAVIGWDSVERAKPAPDMVLAFCARCGLAPGEVAVIGDNSHDLEMAEAAGAGLKIGVLSGNSERRHLEDLADLVIEDISHLSALVAPPGRAAHREDRRDDVL